MIFLKLGGSLITDKARRETPKVAVLQRVAHEIHEARRIKPELKLLIGHGSGSYGHPAAELAGIQSGVRTAEDWRGFLDTWAAAQRLHRLVLDTLSEAELPVFSFLPSALAVANDGEIVAFPDEPIRKALRAGLIPLVQGDVAFDRVRGGVVLSTERIMAYLAIRLKPERILLAGLEEGVYERYPERNRLLPELAPKDLPGIDLGGSEAPDVTGGMSHKVQLAIELAQTIPGVEVRIFSGGMSGNVQAALLGYALGTRVRG
ncbi:MAG TPA: isopentenyl phosphate kinase [Anaerolineales bacterium]|nr:isopentenyl phosphate kinase [Anaerolineales bacterium]